MKWMVLFLGTLLASPVAAQVPGGSTLAMGSNAASSAASSEGTRQCPDGAKLPNLCTAIGNHMKEDDGVHDFYFQKIVHEAACIAPSDSEAVAREKIQAMWLEYQDRLICNNGRFVVQDGSVLKYAVSSRNEDFLFDAAYIWQVELNKVDASDNRTLLDFVSYEIEKNTGTSMERTLRSYYETLRAAGARHRSEL